MVIKDTNRRLVLTIPQEYMQYLEERRNKEGRSMSNMAAFLLKSKIDEEIAKNK